MLTVAALIIASKTALPDIAFSARYYKPGKEKSYYHLYLCKFDGTSKNAFGSTSKSQLSPIWLDRDSLAYVEIDGTPAIESSLGKQKSFRASIKLLNLKTRKSRTLLSTKIADGWTDYGDNPNTIVMDGTAYTISKKGVSKGKYVGKDYFREFGKFDLETEKGTNIIPASKGSSEWKVEWTYASSVWKANYSESEYQGLNVVLSSKESVAKFSLKGNSIQSVVALSQTKTYIVTHVEPSRLDNDHFVYELDCKKSTSKLLVSNIGDINIQPDKSYWIGNQPGTKPLGDVPDSGQVWINSLYSGDLKTGKRWTIADGLVHLSNYATRPLK